MHPLRTCPQSNKQSGLPVGVTRYVETRQDQKKAYVIYSASWSSSGVKHVRKFYAGRADDLTRAQERHAKLTAIAFREEYERCRAESRRMALRRWMNWREEVLYPTSSKTTVSQGRN